MTGVLLGILLMTCTAGSLARNLCPTHKMDAVIHKLGTKTNETKKLLKCVVWLTGAEKIVDAISVVYKTPLTDNLKFRKAKTGGSCLRSYKILLYFTFRFLKT